MVDTLSRRQGLRKARQRRQSGKPKWPPFFAQDERCYVCIGWNALCYYAMLSVTSAIQYCVSNPVAVSV